jgi:hypothetical protein
MADERQEPPHEAEPSAEGAPPGGDPDYHLHSELGEEAKRLATHPREEAHRLAEEMGEGKTETTPFLVMVSIALGLALLVAVVLVLVFVVVRLAN